MRVNDGGDGRTFIGTLTGSGNRGGHGAGTEASDASTDRFRRVGVGAAHRAIPRFRGLTSRSRIAQLLLLSVLLLPAFAGCVVPPNLPSYVRDFNEDNVWFLGILAVAICFILLAAGVRIKIPWIGSFRPPKPKNRTGRVFLAVLGVLLMSSFLVLRIIPFTSDLLPPVELLELSPCRTVAAQGSRPSPTTKTSQYFCRGLLKTAPEIPTPVARLSGEVSFIAYEDEFENYYSTLRIGRGPQLSEARIDNGGQFTIDVPLRSTVTVTWYMVEPSEYVLWPMEIDLLAERSGSPAGLSFEFLKIDDVFIRQKNEAIRAIRECEFEKADAVLNTLLPVLEQFGDSVPRVRTWPHDVHRDLANEVAAHRSCADDDGGSSMSFERKWRREAIERATTLEGRVLAINTWAGLSVEMYRPQGLAWPDATLVDVDLVSEGYRNSLREDLHLVKTELARSEIRGVVSNEIVPTGIGGCLNVGQRDAFGTFRTLLAEPVEEINLNRLMNAISGLQRIGRSRWLLGTWIDYPDEGYGEIEIIRERVVDGFEYYFSFTQYGGSRTGRGTLTLEPEQSAPCRFEITGGSSDQGNRDVFVILEDGRLRNEFTNRYYPAKGESTESPGG